MLLLHGSVNGREDWLRFGHCKDTELRVGLGADFTVRSKEPGM